MTLEGGLGGWGGQSDHIAELVLHSDLRARGHGFDTRSSHILSFLDWLAEQMLVHVNGCQCSS